MSCSVVGWCQSKQGQGVEVGNEEKQFWTCELQVPMVILRGQLAAANRNLKSKGLLEWNYKYYLPNSNNCPGTLWKIKGDCEL